MNKLIEVASVFLKLGFFAFGGPAAHIAMMEEEVVTRRKWMNRQDFLDILGVTNLIPGPNSTEMAIHCGYHRAGRWGLIVAGVCFIGPAVALTILAAYIYTEYGSIPNFEACLQGIKPAVLVIMTSAVIKLGRKALKSKTIAAIGVVILCASILGLNEVMLIFVGALLGGVWLNVSSRGSANCISPLFLIFLKIGSILFGSGYVLVVYLRGELVERLSWLTDAQLLDAVAIGQITPGPVLSTAAFVGYQLQGFSGALLAAAGIFLPAFVLVYFLFPWVPKFRSHPFTANLLDAVNISAVALMVAVVGKLGIQILVVWQSLVILAICTLVFVLTKRIGPIGVIIAGGLMGCILF